MWYVVMAYISHAFMFSYYLMSTDYWWGGNLISF